MDGFQLFIAFVKVTVPPLQNNPTFLLIPSVYPLSVKKKLYLTVRLDFIQIFYSNKNVLIFV